MKTLSIKTLTVEKRSLMPLCAAALFALCACAQESATDTQADTSTGAADSAMAAELTTMEEKFSYVFGMNIGQQIEQLQEQNIAFDIDIFLAAINDVRDGKELKLTEQQAQEVVRDFQTQQRERQAAEQQVKADANKAEGEAYLTANAEKEGVQVTDSGLQYKVITEGSGPKPTAEDRVTVHYRGTLIDGTEFDSSYSRNEPATFPLNGVIAGWTEGLQLMAEGAKYEFYIPSDLAYGARDTGRIGPNSTLIFEVELIKAKAE